MSFFDILDLVIGIIFIYFLLSLICSIVLEIISNLLSIRANDLRDWMFDTFNTKKKNDKCLGEKVFDYFIVNGLSKADKKVSYIPSAIFAEAIFQIIVHEKTPDAIGPYTISELEKAIIDSELLDLQQKQTILQYIQNSRGLPDTARLIKVKESFMEWFDNAMERLTGHYKRRSQIILLFIGLVITLLLNVDTIALSKFLYNNPQARTQLAEAAAQATKDTAFTAAVKRLSETKDTIVSKDLKSEIDQISNQLSEIHALSDSLNHLNLPLGWPTKKSGAILIPSGLNLISKIAGLIITALALTLNANFWFDMLNKLVNLRAGGKKPPSSIENGIEG